MQSYTYLLINFLTIIICFIFSFDKRIRFNQHFGAFIKGSILAAIPFIAWDVWFAKMGIWWFNTHYTIGYRLAGLPLEEWLFFICIPFSCLFTYFCLDKFFKLNWANKFNKIIVSITLLVCLAVAVFYNEKNYTLVTALATATTVFYLYFVAKVDWIGKASLVFFILMLGFFPVNGVLTGTGLESPIVNYNSGAILNIRMLSIPIEDAVYGYAQFLLNIYFFLLFKKKQEL
jgi:lycopene cyclase domain-containing protein